MATRHIKRLQQQLDASKGEPEAAAAAASSEEEEESDTEEAAKPFNPFDLLEDEDDDEEVRMVQQDISAWLQILVKQERVPSCSVP